MNRVQAFVRSPWGKICLSALLAALPMTFPSLFLLSWVGFVPFFLVILSSLGEGNFFQALFRGAFFGFCYHFFVYFWFLWLYPLDFAGLDDLSSLAVVLLGWIGISFVHGLLYALPTLACHFAGKRIRNAPFLLFLAIAMILLAQRITEASEIAFPWLHVALGQYRAPVLIQSASLFGIEGVDFLILAFCALIALFFHQRDKKRWGSLLCAVLLFAGNLSYGLVCLNRPSGTDPIRVAAVQGCILSGEKWSGSSSATDTYFSLTRECADEDIDLVVWPESALPSNLKLHPDLLALLQSLSGEVDTPILTGCFWKNGVQSTNSAVLLTENTVSEPYSKRHLVPFGERMPYRAFFETFFPFLGEINMLSSDLAAGESSALMELGGKKLGTLICFESLFPSLASDSVKDGAQLLVLVTNDSWYEDSPAVWQHLAHAVFRSVETRRSTVRCANSGVSAIIDETGRITRELGPLKQGFLEGEVSYCDEITPFVSFGPRVLYFLGAVLVLWGLGLCLRERRKRYE